MEIVAAAIIGGVLSFLGNMGASMEASKTSAQGIEAQKTMVEETNKANKELYLMQREDAAKAMQTRVADLKAAGLNPALATGASEVAQSSPMQAADLTSGYNQMASIIANGWQNAGNSLNSGIQNAISAQKQEAEIDNMHAQNAYLESMAKVNEARVQDLTQKYGQSQELFASQKKYLETQIEELQSRIPLHKAREQKLIDQDTSVRLENAYFAIYGSKPPATMPVGELTRSVIQGGMKFGLNVDQSGNYTSGHYNGNKSGLAGTVATLGSVLGLDLSGSKSKTVSGGIRDPEKDAFWRAYVDSVMDDAYSEIRAEEARKKGDPSTYNSEKEKSKNGLRRWFSNRARQFTNGVNSARVYGNDLLDLK